jgi:DNA (cytosine-5)-methyltransferase 1
MPLRALEFFSGLGGWRYSLGDQGRVVRAFDISEPANATYALNHGVRPATRELATLRREEIASFGADLWLLSPPCQPFCRTGSRLDLADPRSRAFLNLMDLLDHQPPRAVALENVEGFLGSQAHELLTGLLRKHGFHWKEHHLCPTRFGIPNQRPRVFILAADYPLTEREVPSLEPAPLAPFLDEEEDPSLYLSSTVLDRHGPGLDVVEPKDRRSACFIGGYGRRWVGSGSFLRTAQGVRRFSTMEIARLLGLPKGFGFPPELPLENRYKLLGNGLNLASATWVLQGL